MRDIEVIFNSLLYKQCNNYFYPLFCMQLCVLMNECIYNLNVYFQMISDRVLAKWDSYQQGKSALFPHILNSTVYRQTSGSQIIWKVKTTVLVVLINLSTDSQLSSHLFKSSRTFYIYIYIFLHIDHGHYVCVAILSWIASSIIFPNCFNCVLFVLWKLLISVY